jgi:MinD superfamily P-loop ATPase
MAMERAMERAMEHTLDPTLDRLEAPKCKVCSGRLRFDLERKTKAPGFSYFRCEGCDMPNVFAAETFAAARLPA